MKRLAIGLAGVIAGFAALPATAAAAPCDLSSYATPLSLYAPDRIAFGRSAAAVVTPFPGWSSASSDVHDVVLTFTDENGAVLESRALTHAELDAAAAANPWNRRPLEVTVPQLPGPGRVTVRLTYRYKHFEYGSGEVPCDATEEGDVRWFEGTAPRFAVAGYGLYLNNYCHELAPGVASVTIRQASRSQDFELCPGPGFRRGTLRGLRVAGSADGVSFNAVGWRPAVRYYTVEARWRGALAMRRWLRVTVELWQGRRVYRDRQPRAFRDICQGRRAGAPLRIRRDKDGRRYCRTPARPIVTLAVLRRAPSAG